MGCCHGGLSAQTPAVIPQPVTLETDEGRFRIRSGTTVFASGGAEVEARKLVDTLAPAMGFQLKLVKGEPRDGAIVLALDESLQVKLGPEG
jgi:hypothetical protein